ncbi:hypothetical protein [Grimontia hollisae]|uniref:Uncharacterized protein n=1 Tax=Grimontia hollisae TaxID=673 RepID=A0A377HME8_GRIHO|nr:hypothetical protein [Grimontia hollisae]STO57193.1 Uncharacterised protein [Grimontia hollisae]
MFSNVRNNILRIESSVKTYSDKKNISCNIMSLKQLSRSDIKKTNKNSLEEPGSFLLCMKKNVEFRQEESLVKAIEKKSSLSVKNNSNYYNNQCLYWNGNGFSIKSDGNSETVSLHKQIDISPISITNGLKKEYEHKKIKVKDFTIKNLEIAKETIDMVKAGLCYGSGNQIVDLFASAGESDLRTIHARTNTAVTHPFSPLISGSSNCGGVAQLTAALLVRNEKLKDHPVSIVKGGVYADGKPYDHDYVIIGDPSDPEYGPENTVVVDPWGVLAIPTTLSESVFPNPNIAVTKPKGVVKAFNKDDMENLFRESTSKIEASVRKEFGVDLKPGKELLQSLISEDDEDRFWNVFITAKDPSTQYYSDNIHLARSFDEVPKNLFEVKLKGFNLLQKLGFGMSTNKQAWSSISNTDFQYQKSERISLFDKMEESKL